MLSQIRPAIAMIVLFTAGLGLGYPLAMTGVSELLFRRQAEGSLVRDPSGQVVGSALIGQAFAKPQYLHGRPSAAGNGYDAANSSGSNLGPLDPKLEKRVAGDADALHREAPGAAIPADAVTTSGSGLDPDISPEFARLQAPRIAAARHAPLAEVQSTIDAETRGRTAGVLGMPRVNVLAVNRALDAHLPVR